MTSSEPHPRAAPIAIWRAMGLFFGVLYNLFGEPQDLARQHTLTRKAYTLCLAWLQAGEAMLRRLLLVEAAALTPAHTPAKRQGTTRARKLIEFKLEDPASWRVSFRCALERRRLAGMRQRRPAQAPAADIAALAPRFHAAWPLAERYEAMLRVFNAPYAYAKRLARKLRVNARAIIALLRHPEHAPRFVGEDDFRALDPHIADARRVFDSRSTHAARRAQPTRAHPRAGRARLRVTPPAA
jgi:hypothetical protein